MSSRPAGGGHEHTTHLGAEHSPVRRSARARLVAALGPLTMLAGVVWALPAAVPDDAAAPARAGLLVARSSSRRCSSSASGSSSRSSIAPGLTRGPGGRVQPPAEHVHWLFATGFLLLGLCLLARGDRRRRGLAAAAPGAPTSGPRCSSALGVLMWPVMVFFTNSTIHMVAHGAWAQAMMLAGAAELGLVRGKLHSPRLAAVPAARARRLRRGVPRPRAERLVLRALRVPAPRARLDAAGRRALPAADRLPAAVAGLGRRSRADVRRRLGAALLRPRRGARLRAPLAARRGAAPVRKLLARRPCSRSRCRPRPRRTRRS